MSDASKSVKAKMLVCDLDNTLYDWVSYFVPSLYAMIREATKIIGCDQEELCNDLRSIHQHYHNTEHPYSLLETATYRNWALGKNSDARARGSRSKRPSITTVSGVLTVATSCSPESAMVSKTCFGKRSMARADQSA